MTDWKDTVKTYGELRTYCFNKGIKKATDSDLRDAQAEITFKLGIKEVVEWVEETYILPVTKQGGLIQVRNLEADLKAKLKSWEVINES